MKTLLEYTEELDKSAYDYGEHFDLRDKLNAIIEAVKSVNENDPDLQYLKLEFELLHVTVSIEAGITPQWSQSGKTTTGEELVVQWPNVKEYTKEDFDYLERRFYKTKNDFVKYMYGMVLFLTKKKQDNQFVTELLNTSFKLMLSYSEKSLNDVLQKERHYDSYLLNATKDAFLLGYRRKANKEILPLYKSITDFIYNSVCSRDVEKEGARHVMFCYTRIIHQNFPEFKGYDLGVVLDKNWELAILESKTYNLGAVDLAKNASELAKKLKANADKWYKLCAEAYVAEADSRGGMVAPDFYISAIKYYKLINDTVKVKELHEKFNKSKRELNFGQFSYKLEQDESEKIMEEMLKEISEKNADFLLNGLARGHIFPRFSTIKKNEDSDTGFRFSKMLSTSIYDKHGNKNVTLNPESDEDRTSYYHSYELHLQIPSKIYFTYFIETIRAKKITCEILTNWLKEKTWYGNEIERFYNGYTRKVIISDFLAEPIKLFLKELEKGLSQSEESASFVCALDSLSLKVEYILRIMCEEYLKIPTTYIKEDGTVEEKTFTGLITDIIKSIQGHSEMEADMKEAILDDIIYVDFFMNSKAGPNIRNVIAHAHLDLEEYDPIKTFLVLGVIMRISVLIKPVPTA